MSEDTQKTQQDEIISQLKSLNTELHKQNTIKYIFTRGIIYGVGFFIGSAILATIALGVFGPIIGQIPWIHDNFVRGSSIAH